MSTHTERDDRDDETLAAEFVLGVLDRDDFQLMVARSAREPEIARMIDSWRGKLAPMTDEIVPVVPPMYLWHRVRARAGIAIDDARQSPSTSWWDRIAFWRGLSMAGLAATAACVIALIALPRTQAPLPPVAHSALPHPVRLVATLHDGKGRNTYVAAVDDDACTMVLMPLVKDATPGQVPQVWLVGRDGTPHAVGIGGDAPLQAITVPDALRTQLLDAGEMAVSMEPPGGSPTGRPTGFVIGKGPLTRL